MASFQIPKRYYQAVKDLIALSEEQSSKLIEVLHELPLSLNLKQTIATTSAKFGDINLLHVEQLLFFLQSLHYLLETVDDDISLQKLVSDIAEAVNEEESLPHLDEEGKRNFSNRLAYFLEASSVLGITAKAAKVLLENERVFLYPHILTDIRTVFKDLQDQPVGALIVHNLRITYRQDGDEKEFFVALDDSDLASLSKQIVRAEAQAKVLKKLLEKAEITYLSVD
jgi:hypothetical protein